MAKKKALSKKVVLITSGATREYIDDVRFISNPSSGKTGYYLAMSAMNSGADVIFITGKSSYIPRGAEIIEITSAADMFEEFKNNYKRADIIIGAAAVGDFTPQKQKGKIKRIPGKSITLKLLPTKDIMAWAGKNKGKKILVGYAAEAGSDKTEAFRKIKSKNLDYIVFNDISAKNSGFETDENEITIISSKNEIVFEGRDSKEKLAQIITALVLEKVEK